MALQQPQYLNFANIHHPASMQMLSEQEIRRQNLFRQWGTPDFNAIHKIDRNGTLPIWDVRTKLNLNLGDLNTETDQIARVVYGVPKQYSVHHGFQFDREDLEDQGYQPEFVNAVLSTEALRGHEATLAEIQLMKRWSMLNKAGLQYVPAGLCPEINIAAKQNGTWADIKQATQCITAAGTSVMLELDDTMGSAMVNDGKPVKLACEEHFQGGVKRPPNSWILYRRDLHKQIVKVFPKMKNTDISKVISQMWKNEREHVKKFYVDYADEINQNFRLNFPNYRFSPRRNGERQRRAPRPRSDMTQAQLNHVINSLPPSGQAVIVAPAAAPAAAPAVSDAALSPATDDEADTMAISPADLGLDESDVQELLNFIETGSIV